jgi:AcrR family transcriptional regulator
VPPPNDRRRADLADATIALLAEAGVHGATHRAVDRRAGLPTGTASNYFRSREALLVAAADRIVELHQAHMDEAAARPRPAGTGPEAAAELIAGSLAEAATAHRDRYLAIFELQLESRRRPALARTLAAVAGRMADFTAGHHAQLGLDLPPAAVPTMLALYGGALFTLVTAAARDDVPRTARRLATAIVAGALVTP